MCLRCGLLMLVAGIPCGDRKESGNLQLHEVKVSVGWVARTGHGGVLHFSPSFFLLNLPTVFSTPFHALQRMFVTCGARTFGRSSAFSHVVSRRMRGTSLLVLRAVFQGGICSPESNPMRIQWASLWSAAGSTS